MYRWSGPSTDTTFFFDAQQTVFSTTSCKNISSQECSQASHVAATPARNTFWLWRSAKTDACSTSTPTSKNTCLSPFEGCCLKPHVANVVGALGQRTSATPNARAEKFTGSVWTGENPPDFFMLCRWTALHSDHVLQHGSATGLVPEKGMARLLRRGRYITRYAAPVCPGNV